ncbi:MAG: type II toxin-antitoxin system Phd/YefM family antitoxin [Ardenticatenales bacterium]|nr:type II toxin-antitoxin system Phd/YefM family antitoxin [Ardenticatenales bacterium]
METVGAYEAKTHLSELLERVARQGARITITRHGVPVAILQPVDPNEQVDVATVIADLRHFRQQNSLGDTTIRDLIEEGRR